MAFEEYKVGDWTAPVVNEADTPKRTAAEMKAVFDSNTNQLKEAYNGLVDALDADGAAGGLKLEGGDTVAEALDAMYAAIANTETICKKYTDDAVFASGAADMLRAVYDTTAKAQDIFEYSAPVAKAVNLAAANWTGTAAPYTQTVAVDAGGRLTAMIGLAMSATAEQAEAARAALLRCTGFDGSTVTVEAAGEDKPETDIPATVYLYH